MLTTKTQKLIAQWLESDLVSCDDKALILKMTTQQKAIAFADTPLRFGTAGIRALIGPGTQFLNVFVYRQMATGYAHFLKISSKKEQPIAVIVHDNRNDGDLYAMCCAEVLAAYNIQVYLAPNNHLLATPIISYWIRKLKADGGINITASHNPKAYNGFKSYNKYGAQVLDKESKIIIDNMPLAEQILNLKYAPKSPLIKYLPDDCLNQFFIELMQWLPTKDFDQQKDLKVLFSSHHGVGSQTMLALASKLNYKNFIEFEPECNITGDYDDSEITNPEEVKSFYPMLKTANQKQINYLMAVDPDGDRFAMAERQKNGLFYYLNGNENGLLFAYYLLEKAKSKKSYYVVASYVTTNFIDRILKKHEIPILRTGTGFKWICDVIEKQESNENHLLIAFEESIGALLFPFNREKDGYQAVGLSLEMITYFQSKNLLLTEILEKFYQEYGYWFGTTHSFVIKHENWKELMQTKINQLLHSRKKTIGSHPIVTIKWNHVNDCLDWILDHDNWLRFRLSGTEPKFKIYYNLYGKNHENINQEIKKIRDELIKELDLDQYI